MTYTRLQTLPRRGLVPALGRSSIQAAWDGNGANPLGWTRRSGALIRGVGTYTGGAPYPWSNMFTASAPGGVNDGANVMFASVIPRPSWLITGVLAPYNFLWYFGDHNGLYLRVGYSQSISGPVAIYQPGTNVNQAAMLAFNPAFLAIDHIGSPHARNDQANSRILMTFHGQDTGLVWGHSSAYAQSVAAATNPGVDFTILSADLNQNTYYFRPFLVGSTWYMLNEGGSLYQSAHAEGLGSWTLQTGDIFNDNLVDTPNGITIRHCSNARIVGNTATAWATRRNENFAADGTPERIIKFPWDVSGSWQTWQPASWTEAVRPVEDYEGAAIVPAYPNGGSANAADNAYRDPCYVSHAGAEYLITAVQGEDGNVIMLMVGE